MNHDIYNLEQLADVIEAKLKEGSLAEVTLYEGFFNDEIIIDHDEDKTDIDHEVIITKSIGIYTLKYREDDETKAILEVDADWSEAINEIVHFVNHHTIHDSSSTEENEEEEEITIEEDKDNGDWVILDADNKLGYGESFNEQELAEAVLEQLRTGAKGTDNEGQYDDYMVDTKENME